MDTIPSNNDNLKKQQEVDILGVVSPQVRMLSWGERLLPYLFAAMETCWVDAILIAMAGVSSDSAHAFFLPLWVPFVLIVSSCWLSNALARRRAASADAVQAPVSFAGTLVVVLLVLSATFFSLWSGLYASSLPFYDPSWLGNLVGDLFLLGPEAFHIVAIIALILYFYWRGSRLAQSTLEPGNVFTIIRLGVGVMLAVSVFRAATNTTAFDEILLLLLIPLFLILALVAHAFAQTVFVRTTHRSGLQGSVFLQERALLVIILFFGGILLCLSLFVGAVASPAFLTDAQRIFTPVVLLYTAIANIIAFIVTLAAIPFIWLLTLFHFRLKPTNYQASTIQALCKKYPHSVQCLKNVVASQNNSGAPLVLVIKILLPIVVVFLLILIVRSLRRRRSVILTRRVEEVHESLWSWALFIAQVKAFFSALWVRFFPQASQVTQGRDDESEGASEPTARSIREVYRAMLRWAAARGYARKRDETPYEFRKRLRESPSAITEPELSTVTEAYTAIRYGRVIPSEDEVVSIQQTWMQLQQKTLSLYKK